MLLFLPALLLSAGCESEYVFPNEAPSQLVISHDACYVVAHEEVTLSAQAIDADDDPIYYRWTASAGTFDPPDGKGREVTWIAPQEPGTVKITLVVTDEIVESRASIEIVVGKFFPTSIPHSVALADSGFTYILDVLLPVVVPEGDTLTLHEGVRVVVMRGGLKIRGTAILRRGVNISFLDGRIDVEGKMVIEGSADDNVVIGAGSCASETGEWSGIGLYSDGQGDVAEGDFSYLRLHSAGKGIVVAGEGASVAIANSVIINNGGNGIEVIELGSIVMRDCESSGNDVGLYVRNGYADVTRSAMRYNKTGLELSAVSGSLDIAIDTCSVSSNEKYGFVIINYARPEIHGCSIFSNGTTESAAAVHLESYYGDQPIPADHNYWGLGNDTEEEISALIYDTYDDGINIKAEVLFSPWLLVPVDGVP